MIPDQYQPWFPEIKDDGRVVIKHNDYVIQRYPSDLNKWYAWKQTDLIALIAVDYKDIIRQINEREGIANESIAINKMPECPLNKDQNPNGSI